MGDLERFNRKRANDLFEAHLAVVAQRADRLFSGLMPLQWMAGICFAIWLSPYTWAGSAHRVHLHVYAAVFLGGLLTSLPVYLAATRSGSVVTRHVVAVSQILMSALLIHLTGGRVETHFHIFGSLAFLAFYRDWKVLLTATLMVMLDHAARGLYWPESVYGTPLIQPARFLEHAGWVLFEVAFLTRSIRQGLAEMREIAVRQASLESANAVTERTVIERTAELRESEARYRVLVESAADGVFVADADGRFLSVNDRGCKSLGYTREELLGMSISDVDPSADLSMFKRDLEALARGARLTINGTSRRKDGTTFPVEIAISGILFDGRPCSLAQVRDVSERLAMDQVLRRSEKLASVGQLAAGVAHEINNPLGVILGFAQSLAAELRPGDALEHPLRSIEREALRCKTLVQSLLTFSRVSPGTLIPTELNAAVKEALLLIGPRIKLEGVTLTLTLAEALPAVLGNKSQLEQVILNLISNSLDAMPAGGTLSVSTQPAPGAASPGVILKVVDSGTGVPAEVKSKIFDPFFTTKPVGKGTGLGLSLASEIVAKHGGEIAVESRPGRTEFRIRLPGARV